MARELPFRDGNAGFSLILKRNCSISPAGLAGVFGALAAVALAIGAAFAFAGAWLVLPFAGLEVAALAVAYLAYARRAADYERIELSAGRLTVEVAEAQRLSRFEIEARRARVCLVDDLVLLRGVGEELQLGRHLDAERRAEFAAQLQKRLRI
ncbi:MAG TPA: DUF2244 domain-containing protein [Burkholderiales bacterium]